MKIKLFTHTDLDGAGCAILGVLAYGRENINIEYCDYNNVDDKIKNYILSDEYQDYSQTFITDISVNEEIAKMINNIKLTTTEFILIDHHQTAKWLSDKYVWAIVETKTDNDTFSFYQTQDQKGIKASGTQLFFNFLTDISIKPVKEFVEIVRQYDTWEWKEIYQNNIPKMWNDLFYILGRKRFIEKILYKLKNKNELIFDNTDKILLELEQNKIDKYIKSKNKQIIQKKIQNYNAGIIFAEQYHSELGNKLSELNPKLDFIVIVNMSKAVSYRTIKDNIDLGNDVAKIYGGGGHSKASGSPISEEIRGSIINQIFK